MCGFGVVDNIYRPYVAPADEVVRRTRETEAAMGGERVPEDAWALFFSASCAPIAPDQFRRMFIARQAAVTYLAVQASTRLRAPPPTPFRCVPD
jgi:hypothetical protein